MNEENLCFLVVEVSRLMRREFYDRLEGSRLTQSQARALKHIAHNEGLKQRDLAEILEIQPITLARLVDQLEEMKLVERRPDPTDRRAYRLHVRPAAAPHIKAIDNVAEEIRAHALEGLNTNERAAAVAALQKIRDTLRMGATR
jgi:DNA-binding MarR family transcriptional regulator